MYKFSPDFSNRFLNEKLDETVFNDSLNYSTKPQVFQLIIPLLNYNYKINESLFFK